MKQFFLFALIVAGSIAVPTGISAKDQGCVTPVDNLRLTQDTTLCQGTYTIPDPGKDGVIIIDADNVDLNCNFAELIGSGGEDAGFGIGVRGGEIGHQNITIRQCTVKDYGNGMAVGDASHVVIENNTFEISGRGKGLQLGNLDNAIDDILIQANIFQGVGNGLSFGAGNPATNIRIFGNSFHVTIDAIVLNGGPARNAYHLRGNRYGTSTGEIIGLHDSDNTVIEFEVMEESTSSNLLIRNSHNATIRNNQLDTAGFQIEESKNGTYDANVVGRDINVTSGSESNTFTNNIVSTNENWAVRIANSTNNKFLNNTFYRGDNFVVIVEGTSPNNRFVNTIIESFGTAPLYSVSAESMQGFTSDYNDLFGRDGFLAHWGATSVSSLGEWRTLTRQDAHSLSSNPEFRDAQRADFHLLPRSPLKNMGDPASAEPTVDFEDDDRPQGNIFDIGADEIKSLSTSGVRLTGEIFRSPDDDFTNRLVIEDTVNDDDARYAITSNDGTLWLQGDGTLGPIKYFSTLHQWTHTHVPANTMNAYRFVVSSATGSEITGLSPCALLLETPSLSKSVHAVARRFADFFTRGVPPRTESTESAFENEYRCPQEKFSVENHDVGLER